MTLGSEHVISISEQLYIDRDPGLIEHIRKQLSYSLAEQLLNSGVIKEERRTINTGESGMGALGTIRLMVNIPETYCGKCYHYDYRTGYCSLNDEYYPENGYCSKGEQLMDHLYRRRKDEQRENGALDGEQDDKRI